MPPVYGFRAGEALPILIAAAVQARYHEPHRRYHEFAHIAEMLDRLEGCRALATDALALTLAVWFHDAVYDPRSSTNEADSAELLLTLCGAAPRASRDKARAMILHSAHHGPSDDPDTRLFCDLDLVRLGAPYETFAVHGAWLRREYAHLDDGAWRAGRRQALTQLLNRDAIYQTAHWRTRCEARARANLRRALAELGDRTA